MGYKLYIEVVVISLLTGCNNYKLSLSDFVSRTGSNAHTIQYTLQMMAVSTVATQQLNSKQYRAEP